MAILRYILPLAAALSLSGCYETFEPKVDTKPVLCLNSLITAGEPINVQVTRTWLFSDKVAEKNHSVDDATVAVYANDTLRSADYVAREGDRIRIVAHSAKYGDAEATVTVPMAAPVISAQLTPEATSTWKDPHSAMLEDATFNMKITLTIADPQAGCDNYFNLAFEASDAMDNDDEESDDIWYLPSVSFYQGTFEYNAEPIFSEHIGTFDSVMGTEDEELLIFSDRRFSGKEYTLHLHFTNASFRVNSPEFDPELYDCAIIFNLAAVSQSYYSHTIYSWQIDSGVIGDLGDLGFAEPVWGYSNVSTGAGVVAARSFASVTLSLKDFLQQTFNNQ